MRRPEVIRYHRCLMCRDLCPAWKPLCYRCQREMEEAWPV